MKGSRVGRVPATLLLLAATLAILGSLLHGADHARLLGLAGVTENGVFRVTGVDADSPADRAGLAVGDRLSAIDGLSIDAWLGLYRERLSGYIERRADWADRPVAVERGPGQVQLVQPRRLDPGELVAYFGIRLTLVLFLLALSLYMLLSEPEDRAAWAVTACFIALAVWIGAELPAWPEFLAPIVPVYTPAEFLARDLTVSFSMQLAVSAFLHVLLLFPRPLLAPAIGRRIIPMVYLLPQIVILGALFGAGRGQIVDRMTDVHVVRLWLDSALILLAVALVVAGHRVRKTPIELEQSRLVMRALAVFTALHLGLWNLPKLLTGFPLVPSYNWMLSTLMLIPLALTVAINNHHAFGIEGLARRRVQQLQKLLARERGAVERRDDRIGSLVTEIEQLKAELRQREEGMRGVARPTTESDRLQRLFEDYPQLRVARATSLVGVSPLWVQVFESMVLASKGWTPVLIVGESGTGKTAVAGTIAKLSVAASGPYREVSCAQFEHADPAFALGRLFGIGTGHGLPNTPPEGRVGLFEECDGGCLFLDDFDRLPLNVQNVLLYPLEGKAFEPGIGSGAPRRVSLKFILATNRDPDELVERGALQADVLARIGAQVRLPPLRDRPEDIPLLIEDFLGRIEHEFPQGAAALSPAALARLQGHDYRRGNVRELHAELRTALGHAELDGAEMVQVEHLSAGLNSAAGDAARGVASSNPETGAAAASRELTVLRRHQFQIRPSELELGLSHRSKTLSNHLRGMCIRALVQAEWDFDVAARDLAGADASPATERVRRKMVRYVDAIAERAAEGTTGRLYNNLPRQYHEALRRAIERFKHGKPVA